MKKEKTKKRKSGFVWFMSVMALSVALLLVCQFVFATNVSADQKFFDNIKINGLDVGGMSVAEAENVVLTDMLNNKKEVELMLVSNDKEWLLNGNDFEVCNNIGNADIKALIILNRLFHSLICFFGQTGFHCFIIKYHTAEIFGNAFHRLSLLIRRIK